MLKETDITVRFPAKRSAAQATIEDGKLLQDRMVQEEATTQTHLININSHSHT
jgi:hypothetical protein